MEFNIIGDGLINMVVGCNFKVGGKIYSKEELISKGHDKKELDKIEDKAKLSHYVKGLCLQYFNGGWHGVYVIVDTNERFVYLKSLKRLKEQKKPNRILKKNLIQDGYTMQRCEYPTQYSNYVGKIIEL
jgi:hypothetical protein